MHDQEHRVFRQAGLILRSGASYDELARFSNMESGGVVNLAPKTLRRWLEGETDVPRTVDTADKRILLGLTLGLNGLHKGAILTEIPAAMRVILHRFCGPITAEHECGELLKNADVLARQGKRKELIALITFAIALRLPEDDSLV